MTKELAARCLCRHLVTQHDQRGRCQSQFCPCRRVQMRIGD